MGMVDLAKNIKSTMEDLRKPRPRAPPKSSLSPWAWKASLFFWRRLAKKNPPKPHVIKPSTNVSSSSHWPPCKRAKSAPIPTKNYTSYATNNKYFYYSYPNHNPNDVKFEPSSLYGDVKTKARSRPSSGSVTPTTCDDSPNLVNMEYQNTLPYFQLHHSSRVPLPGSTGRLPLYIVS